MDLTKIKKIYFVGIKGVGMCSLAVYAKKRGFEVVGSDLGCEFVTDEVLKENKIKVKVGFEKENIDKDSDLVITTGAHGGMENIEVKQAKKLGISVLTQAEALGVFFNKKRGIAVCGVGGKSTVSAIIATIFKLSGFDPSFVVGVATINPIGAGGGFGRGDYFIAEADEYCACPGTKRIPRFSFLAPEIIVLTNLEYDHPDFYRNFSETKAAFADFVKSMSQNGYLVINYDNKNNRTFINKLKKDKKFQAKIVSYGFLKGSDILIKEINDGKFELWQKGRNLGNYMVKNGGRINLANGAAAVIVASIARVPAALIKKSLVKFLGTKRRFEKIGQKKAIYVFDDYAHHPIEVEATINLARCRFADNRIIIIFQPHTFSRTKSMLGDFAKSLASADKVILTDIFASFREGSDRSVTSKDLVNEINKIGGSSQYFAKDSELISSLVGKLRAGDVVITMGAGDVYTLAPKLLAKI